MNCEVCNKVFTGITCFQQHMQSEKHKKRVREREQCQTFLDKLAPHASEKSASHLHVSMEHKVYNSASENNQLSSLEGTSKATHEMNVENDLNLSTNFKFEENKSLYASAQNIPTASASPYQDLYNDNHISIYQPGLSYFAKCTLCDKVFSGMGNCQQHIASALHKKKLEMYMCSKNQTGIKSPSTSNNMSMSNGDPCSDASIQENGGIKANLSFKILLEKSNISEANGIGYSTVQSPYYCEYCGKLSTGPIPYRAHLESNGHRKKVELRILIDNQPTSPRRKPENGIAEIVKKQKVLDYDEDSEMSMQNWMDYEIESHDSTSIDDAKANARKLNVKVFGPDEPLSLKKSEMASNCVVEDDQMNDTITSTVRDMQCEASKMVQTSEQLPEFFEKCACCDVILRSKVEFLQHYDSKDHYLKKWQEFE